MILLFALTANTWHKEYYSLTEINYNKNDKALQMSMRLFTNDIDLALKKHFNKPTEIGTENEISDADKLLTLYLNQKFIIEVNNQIATYNFVGKEFEKDVTYVYLEILDIKKVKNISVQNSVLTEIFNEQENIVKLHINDTNKSLILSKENDKGMLKF